MLDMQTRAPLVERQGRQWQLGAYIVDAALTEKTGAFALGDGTLRLLPLDPQSEEAPHRVPVHEGACLALARSGRDFITGGDDGKLRRTSETGASETLLDRGAKWIETVAAAEDGSAVACTSGRGLFIVPKRGDRLEYSHASSVTALAFDARGKRLAAAHYNGVSLWWANGRAGQKAETLSWKGSHISATWSPDGKFIVTGMQEQALHGWRVADRKDMRMSGYPAKTRSFSWSLKGKFLATSGADRVICWPFASKDGPMGKPPLEVGLPGPIIRKVACHPRIDILAAGREDGSIVIYRLDQDGVIPVKAAGDGEVTALAWREDGRALLFGTERGAAGIVWFLPQN
jgi:WD40 repeat protein